MSVIFHSKDHKYESLDPKEIIDWLGVTTFVGLFKNPFDPIAQSIKSSKNKKSIWFGKSPELIQHIWEKEKNRANGLGTWYHGQREDDVLSLESIERSGIALPIIKPIMDGSVKHAPQQSLQPGIYPEHFAYLKSAGICGQADRIEIVGQYIDVYDYKTNKKIEKESYKDWEGVSKKMLHCLSHLDDCNFYHYALQLSIYMYIIHKHNHQLTPRNLILHHVIFEEIGKDEYGYPITKLDDKGDPIVKSIVPYQLPYLKREVQDMIKWLAVNRETIKKK